RADAFADALLDKPISIACSRLIVLSCPKLTSGKAMKSRARSGFGGGKGPLLSRSTIAYNTGNTTKVRMVAVISPPTTTVAKGRCTSAPAELDMAMGRKPRAAAEAVR